MSVQTININLSEGITHCHVHDEGQGDWVVLVHGLIIPQFAWQFLFDDLVKKGYKVVSFDLYGRGESAIPDIEYTFDVYLKQIDEVVKYFCKSDKPHLVGWSMGGALVSIYAMEHSKDIQKIALISPGIYISSGHLIRRLLKHDLTSSLFLKLGQRILRSQLIKHVYTSKIVSDYKRNAMLQTNREGFWKALVSIIIHYPENLADRLNNYKTLGPSPLILWGEDDKTTTFSTSEDVLALLGGTLFSLPNAAHAVHYEYPNIINKKITDHLYSTA